MEFTCKYVLSMAIIAILMATIITSVCVYGIKPDYFKYKMNDTMTQIVKGKTTYVSVGKLNSQESLTKIGEKLSLIVGRKLDNYDDFDVYALKGRSTKELIVVEFESGERMLFAKESLVSNPPEIDEEFYAKAGNRLDDVLKIGDTELKTIIGWDEMDEDMQDIIKLTGLATAIYYVVL